MKKDILSYHFPNTVVLCMFISLATILQAQTLIVDDFSKQPTNTSKKYSRHVTTQEGYDIYYEDADVQLSLVQIGKRDTNAKALRINFELPPIFSWGNWLSIRREFSSPLNLSDYQGLELDLFMKKPAHGAFLRITLSDLTDDRVQGDEMWWFDCKDPNLLKSPTKGWIKVRIPFDGFYLSRGAGTRKNDYKLNLKKISAYEINIISNAGKHSSGVMLIDSMVAYK